MIRYALKCAEGHGFESWFKSAEAFDGLKAADMVACPVCGDVSVDKAIMAPGVASSRSKGHELAARPERPLDAPGSEAEASLSKIRKHVEENCDYVGGGFAAEARKMHDGDTPVRSIYGEAKLEDAKKLVDDGIPVAPLPFIPQRKTN